MLVEKVMPPADEYVEQRARKLEELREKGLDLFPHSFPLTHHAAELLEKHRSLKKEGHNKGRVCVAGRIMSMRRMGKAGFAHLQDQSGRIQVYIREDVVGKGQYFIFQKLDVGDLVGVKGHVFRTKLGELSVLVEDLTLLTKSLRPLPEKWHGLKDVEQRYRRRYLDLIANPDIKHIFITRTKVIDAMRDFLVSKGFVEVDTPVLQPMYGGTNARPFKSFLHELKMDVYLRISNELYLKRLIVGGFEKIFEFSKDFRNEGIDRTHNPEFTQMETMWAYADYTHNMDLTEEMIEYIAKNVLGTTKFTYQGQTIDVKRPWKRITMADAIKTHVGVHVEKMTDEELQTILRNHNIEYKGDFSRGVAIELLFGELVENKLIQPTLVYDFPHETCVLAKQKKDNPFYAERFEPYIHGWELGNSYSEENRPEILRTEWEKQEKRRLRGDEEAQRMDEDFIRALEIGLPPTSGLGIGVDRLVMLLTDSPSIRDVLLFPFMKPETSDETPFSAH